MKIFSVTRRGDIPAQPELFMKDVYYGMFDNAFIVFWTKNFMPMMPYLGELEERKIKFYVHYVVNGHGADVEKNVPYKADVLLNIREIASTYGIDAVVPCYEPIFVDKNYTVEWHKNNFTHTFESVKGLCNEICINYMRPVGKAKGVFPVMSQEHISELFTFFRYIAKNSNVRLTTCIYHDAATILERSRCIDIERIRKIAGWDVPFIRQGVGINCGCHESIEYDNVNRGCVHKCTYCSMGDRL